MTELVLEFHDWRRLKSDDLRDPIALFHFSLLAAGAFDRGERPTHEQSFWCEAGLSRDLAERGAWRDLNRDQKVRVLFQHAVESIRGAGRILRQAPLFWRPGTGIEKGPAVSPASVPFPKMQPLRFAVESSASTFTGARAGAGL